LRAELYYALAALTIPMPPLHKRSGDIPAISAFFLGLRGATLQVTPMALAALQGYAWPGNVRELRHVIDYAASVCKSGAVLISHLPPHIASAAAGTSEPRPSGELDVTLARWLDQQLSVTNETPSYDTLLDRIEAIALRHLLARYESKPTHLAAELQMNRATLRQKLRRAGLASE
jgi:transcriptional regulator of acetoin/glycerol metabolism